MKHQAITRYDYHKWANNSLLEHLDKLPEELYGRQIESVFSSISAVISHIYQVDGLWLSVMSGDSFEETKGVIQEMQEKLSDSSSLERMKELFSELSNRYESFLSEQKDLDRELVIEHPSYGKHRISVSSMVEHVVNHGTYHRGNIAAMLRQEGHAAVPTDYIFYLLNPT
ncbi:MAG: DinB family protein [Vicingaceae bacterium]